MRTYNTVLLNVQNGDNVLTADFPHIEGRVVGFATTVNGTRTAGSAQIVIKEGASNLHRPLDINFSETKGRCSFEDSLLKLGVNNPGALSAELTIPNNSTSDFTVEVLVVSEKVYC